MVHLACRIDWGSAREVRPGLGALKRTGLWSARSSTGSCLRVGATKLGRAGSSLHPGALGDAPGEQSDVPLTRPAPGPPLTAGRSPGERPSPTTARPSPQRMGGPCPASQISKTRRTVDQRRGHCPRPPGDGSWRLGRAPSAAHLSAHEGGRSSVQGVRHSLNARTSRDRRGCRRLSADTAA